MPVIVAVCPYCRVGQVRAPDRAIGLAANCPKCQSNFTISAPEAVTDTAPVAAVAETQPAVAVIDSPTAVAAPVDPPEPAVVPALVALILAGLALAIGPLLSLLFAVGLTFANTLLQYARIPIAVLAGVGLPLALFTLVYAERKRLLPGLATAANAAALLLVLVVPGWLSMGYWVPPPADVPADVVRSIDHGSGLTVVGTDWVDAAKSSWQLDDVKVSVKYVTVGAVELTGPQNKKKWTKDKPLVVAVRVANDGVVRKFDFGGWRPPAHAPKLTDNTGAAVPEKAFEKDWFPPGNPWTVALFPGKATEQTFYFDPPARSIEGLRLELPGGAVGLDRPVRLQIPRAMILSR